MKQKLLIITGLIFLFLLIAVWLYILFFGAPKSMDEVFTDLGLGGTDDPGLVILPEPEPVITDPVVNVSRPRLRQLTTKPVAGFVEVPDYAAKKVAVHYVELGEGRIYRIDLDSGEETRISNVTIPETSLASLSSDGKYVALRTKNQRRAAPLTIGELVPEAASMNTYTIEKEIIDFSIINNEELVYTLKTPSGTTAFKHNLLTQEESLIFSVPFYEINTQWATTSSGKHFIYNKPTHLLEGILFSVENNQLKREPVSGFGLNVLVNYPYAYYSEVENAQTISKVINLENLSIGSLPFAVVPEKCTFSPTQNIRFWCAQEENFTLPYEFPDTWYRGELALKDSLTESDMSGQQSTILVNLLEESGREVDIMDLTIGTSRSALYFKNKNDNTLWMYEL